MWLSMCFLTMSHKKMTSQFSLLFQIGLTQDMVLPLMVKIRWKGLIRQLISFWIGYATRLVIGDSIVLAMLLMSHFNYIHTKKAEEDDAVIEFVVYVKSCDVVISMLYIQIVVWSNHLCRSLIILCIYLYTCNCT
ncbi:hypothetical protein SETIT_4G171500v2 [Setaria italica]|uniref:Uncharacterized protein n=1 Tax=Setaria italica TaxID=4555 RepID=A0A368QVK6_SETIT|nr:hypothetical protein SETIT_4G171500v2 [Setaria italica]